MMQGHTLRLVGLKGLYAPRPQPGFAKCENCWKFGGLWFRISSIMSGSANQLGYAGDTHK